MKTILAVVEQEQEYGIVIDRALALAKTLDAKIHVLICCYQELSWFTDVFDMLENKRIKEKIMDKHEQEWCSFAQANITQEHISYEVVWNKYFTDEVLNQCKQKTYDFLIKKGHRSESRLFTPADYQLLRDSTIPVYIAIKENTDSNRPLMVALDLFATSDEKQFLNEKLLTLAAQFAQKLGNQLHCCFAIPIPVVMNDLVLMDIDQYIEDMKVAAMKKAESLFNRFDLPMENLHIGIGSSENVICDQAKQFDVSAIVVGSQGKKGVAGKVLGNCCEQVLHQSEYDLIVVGL